MSHTDSQKFQIKALISFQLIGDAAITFFFLPFPSASFHLWLSFFSHKTTFINYSCKKKLFQQCLVFTWSLAGVKGTLQKQYQSNDQCKNKNARTFFFWDVRHLLLRDPCLKSRDWPLSIKQNKKRKIRTMFHEFEHNFQRSVTKE